MAGAPRSLVSLFAKLFPADLTKMQSATGRPVMGCDRRIEVTASIACDQTLLIQKSYVNLELVDSDSLLHFNV